MSQSKDDEADAIAIWRTFDAFHTVISKTRPYSLMTDDLRAKMASDLTVAFETRRANRTTEALLAAALSKAKD